MSDPAAAPEPEARDTGSPQEQSPEAAVEPQEATDQNQRAPGAPSVVVRYGLMRHIGRFTHNLDPPPAPGLNVVVRTGRGVELGQIVRGVCDEPCEGSITNEKLCAYLAASGPEYPFAEGGKVLRAANRQDTIDYRHLQGQAREEAAFCRQQVRKANLPMRIITVEHLLGGERIVFYFSSEARVDFRQLVRKLAAQYRTRIEMRQVGARDEARLVADYERCGQRCCCQEFLKQLKPVSMRMAKMQKATLDPTKISGRCGRLMCCLRFEDATYDELRKALPAKNTLVRTKGRAGKVTETQILTQLVKLLMPDGTAVVVANEDIVERDLESLPVQLPKVPEAVEQAPARPAADKADKPEAARRSKPPAAAHGPGKAKPKRPRRKKGRRRRPGRKPKAAGQADGGKPSQPASPKAAPAAAAGKKKSKRRNRRSRRK